MRETALEFLNHAAQGEPFMPKEAAEIKEQQDFVVFLEALSGEFRRRWTQNKNPDHQRSSREMTWLRDARLWTESLNLPVPMILRSLYISLGTRL